MKTLTIRVEDIPVEETARQFLQSLDLSQREVVLEQNGELRGVWMPAKVLEQRRQAKNQLSTLVDRIRRQNPDLNSDDVLRELEELDQPE